MHSHASVPGADVQKHIKCLQANSLGNFKIKIILAIRKVLVDSLVDGQLCRVKRVAHVQMCRFSRVMLRAQCFLLCLVSLVILLFSKPCWGHVVSTFGFPENIKENS